MTALMSLILLMTALSGYGGTTQDTGTVLTRFLAPDVHAKPMARMWFPDAGAGEATKEQLDKLGVRDMKFVSGTGEYTLTFTTPEDHGVRIMGSVLLITF